KPTYLSAMSSEPYGSRVWMSPRSRSSSPSASRGGVAPFAPPPIGSVPSNRFGGGCLPAASGFSSFDSMVMASSLLSGEALLHPASRCDLVAREIEVGVGLRAGRRARRPIGPTRRGGASLWRGRLGVVGLAVVRHGSLRPLAPRRDHGADGLQ